jgi:hypothetical protein
VSFHQYSILCFPLSVSFHQCSTLTFILYYSYQKDKCANNGKINTKQCYTCFIYYMLRFLIS